MLVNGKMQGDYTIFGYTRDPAGMQKRLLHQLGINAKTIKFGEQGEFFYFSTYGDVAETQEAVVLKLGFIRSKTKSAMSAEKLLAQKLVGPERIETDQISGNGLVIGINKQAPGFVAFQTLMAVPQLYYSEWKEGIVCSDVLSCLLRIIPVCELDESVIPQHFLFRSIYGPSTYFHGVKRLITGQYMRWVDGHANIQLVRSLDIVLDEVNYIRDDKRALILLSQTLEDVIGDYVGQIEESGQGYANLLSGGIDSTLVQYYINIVSSQQRKKSISYDIQVPAFQFEVGYARQASQLLNTEHTFVNYTPQDFPHLLTRVVEILAQPPNLEIEPSFLAVAECVKAMGWSEKFFFSANAADAIFGNSDSWKLKGLDFLQKFPGAAPIMMLMGKVLVPFNSRFNTLLKGAEIIANQNNPDAYCSPSNTMAVTVHDEDWNILRRSFGDPAIREALATRRVLASQYSKSEHYLDKVHFIDQLTYTYEIAAQEQQIFLANHLEMAHPFNDEDLLKVALLIHPNIRYIKGFTPKHLLKSLLKQKSMAQVAHKRKGGSAVNEDLIEWMRSGSLRPMVEEIIRPGFMSKADFDHLLRNPDYFLWSLLTYDLFLKRF